MLGAAIVAAVAAFGLLVAGLVTGQVWLAIACVIAAVLGLVLLLIDIRRAARANLIEDAPTTGAFLGEDVDAFVARREERRGTGQFAAVAGSRGVEEDSASAPIQRAVEPRPEPLYAGFREPEPDFTGPLRLGSLAAGAAPEQPIPPQPIPPQPGPPQPVPAQPVAQRPPYPPVSQQAASAEPSSEPPASGPAFTLPTVSEPAPAQQAPAGRRRRVGDLHDYVASTGSIPKVETSDAIPTVVADPGGIRWESSIPPSGSALVSDQSREAMRHVNDLPSAPPAPRRPRREEPPRAKPIDPLDPNWRPPLD